MGDQARYVGPIGQATVAKLVHNCAGYAMNVALAEVFTMGVKAGVDPLTLFEAVRQGALGRRRTFDGLIDQFLPGTYDPPAFHAAPRAQGRVAGRALGKEVCVPMRVCNLTLEEMTEAMNRGWDERDSRSAMLLQQERAGVKIAVDAEKLQASLKNGDNRHGRVRNLRHPLRLARRQALGPFHRRRPARRADADGLFHLGDPGRPGRTIVVDTGFTAEVAAKRKRAAPALPGREPVGCSASIPTRSTTWC